MRGVGMVGELTELLGAQAVSATADDLRRHSYDVWPVTAKWRELGKQPYRPDVVVRVRSTRGGACACLRGRAAREFR